MLRFPPNPYLPIIGPERLKSQYCLNKHSTDNEHGSPVSMPNQESRFCEPSFERMAKGREFVRRQRCWK